MSFNIPRGGKQTPFYDVDLDPCNGSVRTVGDFRKSSVFRIGEGGVIEQKQGNKMGASDGCERLIHRGRNVEQRRGNDVFDTPTV